MIAVFHNRGKETVEVIDMVTLKVLVVKSTSLFDTCLELAQAYPNRWLLWCDVQLKSFLNEAQLSDILHHQRMMLSFQTDSATYLGPTLGYVEDSPFVNVQREGTYPTWQMSTDVGAVHAQALLQYDPNTLGTYPYFGYALNSIAKLGIANGLFCYSEPRLLKGDFPKVSTTTTSTSILFRFVKEHYRGRWVYLLLLNLWLYERRFPLWAFLKSLFHNRMATNPDFTSVGVQSSKEGSMYEQAMDVIIPTIGRKSYLLDVLKDLAAQSRLPKRVIIVEQNPDAGTTSELNYISEETWPFEIIHQFTHETGACKARNKALDKVTSPWVFLADDDNRLGPTTIADAMATLKQYGAKCLTTAYPQPSEKILKEAVRQWSTFGAGNSFLYWEDAKKLRFDEAFEFGYGEDQDFGMRLRKNGMDVLYSSRIEIQHLKAPRGGFRTKFEHPWTQQGETPKPSPTIMLFRKLHHTPQQLKGYKITLFIKYFKEQSVKNAWKYLKMMRTNWRQSEYWADQLRQKTDAV